MAIKIYVEHKILWDDLIAKESLSKALGRLREEGKAEIFVLSSSNSLESKNFGYEIIAGGFDYLKSLENVTKDYVFISRDIDKLVEWSELRGKGILATRRPTNTFDIVNRFCPEQETEDEVYNDLKKFIHI